MTQNEKKQETQKSTKETYTVPDSSNVDLSWQRYLLPKIHKEGVKIFAVAAAIVIILGLLSSYVWIVGFPILLFVFYFFRNPERVTPADENLIISPADGVVSNIKYIVPPKEMGLGEKEMLRVSIFMSVFNVHVNRAPVSGTVTELTYRPGKFLNIADKDNEDNERQEITITRDDGTKIGFIQIAGLVAKRIYCPLSIGDKLKKGSIFGMIRFGSRLDVYLPEGVYPKVLPGQLTVAGETVIAECPIKK